MSKSRPVRFRSAHKRPIVEAPTRSSRIPLVAPAKSRAARAIALFLVVIAACSTRDSSEKRDSEVPAECSKYAAQLRQCFPKIAELRTFETRFNMAGKEPDEIESTRKSCAAQSERLEASCLRLTVKRTEESVQ